MRQTWKGMIFGALAGAAVGLALEALSRLGAGAKRAAHETSTQAPVVGQALSNLAGAASQKLQDSGLADHAKDAAKRAGEQAKSKAEAARDTLGDAAQS